MRGGPALGPALSERPLLWRLASLLAPLAVFAVIFLMQAVPEEHPLRAQVFKTFGPYSYTFIVDTIGMALALAVLALMRGGAPASLRELGIAADPLRPVLFGFVATAPALIGFALTAHLSRSFTPRELIMTCGYFPFFEEVIFRGLVFGQLYGRAGLNFWVAALVPAAIFAAEHGGQGASV